MKDVGITVKETNVFFDIKLHQTFKKVHLFSRFLHFSIRLLLYLNTDFVNNVRVGNIIPKCKKECNEVPLC